MVQRTKGISISSSSTYKQVNVEHRMLGDEGNVLEANDIKTPESSSLSAQDAKVSLNDILYHVVKL